MIAVGWAYTPNPISTGKTTSAELNRNELIREARRFVLNIP